MRWNFLEPPSKLSSIPPIERVFRENALRCYLAVAIRRDCFKTDLLALDPMELRWYHPEGSITLFPTIIPSDIHQAHPTELLKLLKCGCSSERPCATMYIKGCSCQANDICVPTAILALVQIIYYQPLYGLGFYRCMIDVFWTVTSKTDLNAITNFSFE